MAPRGRGHRQSFVQRPVRSARSAWTAGIVKEGRASTAADRDGFTELVGQAAGHAPYPYQRRLAQDGLPELLRIPTGAGKTLAATLPWLYRRRLHPDPRIRGDTPHWLVFVLPMRVLVEQARDVIAGWLGNAGLAGEVGLHVVAGGEGRQDSAWRRQPERDAIFVGTLDMLISRALNRGYAASRFAWPIDFGLFNSGCQWVFDEVQLMGPALPTSRQLEGLRRKLGSPVPCRSMWMSATIDERQLSTWDLPAISSRVELGQEDLDGPLGKRLGASKTIQRLNLDGADAEYGRSLAEALARRHRPGTLTIAMLNTVQRAQEVWRQLITRLGADGIELVLIHSRFRPPDRSSRLEAALRPVKPTGPGRIVVSTQVLEAGVDISAATLFTEAAPWPSIVQRSGRCNREGDSSVASLLWVPPPTSSPYYEDDVRSSADELTALEGVAVTAAGILQRQVAVVQPIHPVLRSRDLIGLFDTSPDVSGNDIDVGRYLREGRDLDTQVAWRTDLEGTAPDSNTRPTRDELCAVPVGQLREWLKAPSGSLAEVWAWRFDHIVGKWQRCRPAEVRPATCSWFRPSQAGTTGFPGSTPDRGNPCPRWRLMKPRPSPRSKRRPAMTPAPSRLAPGSP